MNNKALTVSVAFALIAVFLVQSYVESIETDAKKKFGTELLVIKAKQNIKEQETINDTMIAFEKIPKNFIEPDSVVLTTSADEKEQAKSLKSFIGAVAMVPISKGAQITYTKLFQPSVRTGLSPQVSPGKRGFTIPVTEVSGVARLVKPGDRVDLIAVLDTGGGKENKIAKTLLQDVVILATGKNVSNNAPRIVEIDSFAAKERVKSLTEDVSFGTVTVELEPQQAQMLALILSNSDNSLQLSLRNNDDTQLFQAPATTVSDVLGADTAKVRTPAGGRR